MFAGDTNVFCSGHAAVQLSREVRNELDKLPVWFAINKLKLLNIYKTIFMVFGNSMQRNTINNSKIKKFM